MKNHLPEHSHLLRLFSGIGLSLDIHHGIDGVFSWRSQQAFIDLTLNYTKEAKSSHIILVRPDDDIDTLSLQIAERLKLRSL